MKRARKVILVVFLAMISASLFGALYLNDWLHSPATHTQLEAELSRALRLPVKIDKLEIGLFGPAKVSGVRIPQGNGNFFHAAGFSSTHQLGPLLRGRLVFDAIVIQEPQFVLVQNAAGQWAPPFLPKEPKAPSAGKTKTADDPESKSDRRVVIKRVQVINGSAQALNREGVKIAQIDGINLQTGPVLPESIEGSVNIARAEFHEWGILEGIKAGFSRTEKKGLIFPSITAAFGGGNITMGFARKPKENQPWSGKIAFKQVDLETGLSEKLIAKINLTGKLDGNISLRGEGSDLKLLTGKSQLTLRDGEFREMSIIRDVGELLGMQDFADFKIHSTQLDVVIGRERVFVNRIEIDAPPLGFSGKGSVKFDGKLALDCQLLVNQTMLVQRSNLEAQFSPPNTAGQRSVGFELRGSLKKPKNNLMERITGTKDRKVQRLLLVEDLLMGPESNDANKALDKPSATPGESKNP